MLVRKSLRILILFKKAFTSLKNNDPLRMGAATAFFAFFALPPISILLSKLLSVLLGNTEQKISGKWFQQLAEVFGRKSASQLENISENLRHIPHTPIFTIIGALVLLLSATTLFTLIKGSLNQLWNIKQKAKGKKSKMFFLEDRLIGVAIILFSSVLFIVSLLTDLFLSRFEKYVVLYLPLQEIIVTFINHVLSLSILSLWFAILFKYLPNVKVGWKAVWTGAFVTSLLYKAGAYILDIVLINGQAERIFGASASIVLVLLFVFYSSLIFYFGAAFTKAYTYYSRLLLRPTANAIAYQITEIEPDER